MEEKFTALSALSQLNNEICRVPTMVKKEWMKQSDVQAFNQLKRATGEFVSAHIEMQRPLSVTPLSTLRTFQLTDRCFAKITDAMVASNTLLRSLLLRVEELEKMVSDLVSKDIMADINANPKKFQNEVLQQMGANR